MASHEHIRPRTGAVTAGIFAILLILTSLIGGCLQVEPEELPPQAASPFAVISESPTVPADTMENTSSTPSAVTIVSPKQIVIFTDHDFPPEIEKAVRDFAEGKTTDTINGFLRWESVRDRKSVV
jgi:hypothetical protein